MLLAGAVGMISETVLLLYYQSTSGVLFQNIGILLMTFMIGLTLGAFVIDKLCTRRRKAQKNTSWLGPSLLAGFGLFNVLIYYGISIEMQGGLALTSLMLIVAGTFVSGIFAFVSINNADTGKGVMTWLYPADLIGGSIGSVAAILFLIPIYGLLVTSTTGALMAISAIAFLRR